MREWCYFNKYKTGLSVVKLLAKLILCGIGIFLPLLAAWCTFSTARDYICGCFLQHGSLVALSKILTIGKYWRHFASYFRIPPPSFEL